MRVQFGEAPGKDGCFSVIKKKKMWKAVLSALFVVLAGTLYACGENSRAGIELREWENAFGEPTPELSLIAPEGQERDIAVLIPSGGQSGGNRTGLENAGQTGPGSAPAPTAVPALCYVHVCGAVKRPGVYALPENSRAADAIAAAGGLAEDAAGHYLNQARKIADGERIYVPDVKEAERLAETGRTLYEEAGGAGTSRTPGEQAVLPVNINTATKEQLMGLNGIGAARAEAILAYRREYGSFRTCEDLMKVDGIKEAMFQKLCGYITVGDNGS